MGAIISLSLNLDAIDKSKIVEGKKGKYYNVTLSVNDDTNDYGQNVSVFDSQSQEEREAKSARNYIGNGKVVWTSGSVSTATKPDEAQDYTPNSKSESPAEDDLPF